MKDLMTKRLLNWRKVFGQDFYVVLRVTKKRVDWVNIRNSHGQVTDEFDEDEVERSFSDEEDDNLKKYTG